MQDVQQLLERIGFVNLLSFVIALVDLYQRLPVVDKAVEMDRLRLTIFVELSTASNLRMQTPRELLDKTHTATLREDHRA